MGAAVGQPDEEKLPPCPAPEASRPRARTAVLWQPVARQKCRVPRASGNWLFNGAFVGDLEDAKRQAIEVGGAHFTKYESWLTVVGSDSRVEAATDPSAALFSQASAAWTPLGASLYNVDRGGVLRSYSEDETPTSIVSNVPATAVSFRVTENEAQRNLGLAIGTSGHAHSHFTLISEPDRGIYAGNASHGWDVRACGSTCEGDVLTIEHTGSEVIFWKNDEVLHALVFSLTPGEQFYAYASMQQAGGEMRELFYVPAPEKPSLSFRMYRFTPTRLRSDGATAVHISQLKFRKQGPPGAIINTRHATASNPGGQNPASQGPDMAIDGRRETKWLDLNKGSLLVIFPASVYEKSVVDEFSFVTGNDADDRDPVQWRLEGSMSGEEWTPLHVQSHFYDTPRERRTQTSWFPFHTAELKAPCHRIADPTSPPCLVTKAAFEAQLRGASCLSWRDFCALAAPRPELLAAGEVELPTSVPAAAFGVNLLIWFLLAMLGMQHGPLLGLAAALLYALLLRKLMGLEPSAPAAVARPWRGQKGKRD